jgi:hypothetical protein
MSNKPNNPFEFEYDESLNIIITKSNIKFYREYEKLDKTKQYAKINFSIYKIEKPIDYFTWLNEPDTETNYQIELYFELDKNLGNIFNQIINKDKNIKQNLIQIENSLDLEKTNEYESWFNCWYLNSKFSNDKMNLQDTYIPVNIEYIDFI